MIKHAEILWKMWKDFYDTTRYRLTFPVPILDEQRKLTEILIFALLCGVSRGFIKELKAFIELLEALQRSVTIKTYVNFHFNITF